MAFPDLTATYLQKRKAEPELCEGDYLFSRGCRKITKQDKEELKADEIKEHCDETKFLEWVDMHFPQKRPSIEAIVLEHPGLVTSGPQFPSEEEAWDDIKTHVDMWREAKSHDVAKCVKWTAETYCEACYHNVNPKFFSALDRYAIQKRYNEFDDALAIHIKYPRHSPGPSPSFSKKEDLDNWEVFCGCYQEYKTEKQMQKKRARVERKNQELERKEALEKRKAEAKAKCAKYIALINAEDGSTKHLEDITKTLITVFPKMTKVFMEAYTSGDVTAVCDCANNFKCHHLFDQVWEAIVKLAPNEGRSIWLKLLNVILVKYHI
jgi:hypothetical protein